ncbi:MAG: HEAT repeat domain-containing protein [Deltaproteobacteria bacterium]|nr:HEAT repeat domain-containing protein [Deltaproteobacteria bacterium]
MLSLLLAAGLALAGLAEDVETAADAEQPTDLRQAAFSRLHAEEHTSALVKLANDADTTPAKRWVAVRALGKNESMAARDALVGFLASDNAPVRIAACLALGERGDRSLAGRVAARLEDKALLVRHAAADALGQLRDPGTIPDLARALDDPSNHYRGTSMWVRRHFVEAIGNIGGDGAIAPLKKALDDGDKDVAGAAIQGFEKVAGFSYGEGRSDAEEKEAWRRWAGQRGG